MEDNCPSSDEESSGHSGSTLTHSETSTEAYSHVPFLTFQHKIVELGDQLGATSTTGVERVESGWNHRAISATVHLANESDQQLKCLFRIPRDPSFTKFEEDGKEAGTEPSGADRSIYDQVAVANLLALHEFPAPRILAFDGTAANAIGSPYTAQEFVEDVQLDQVYDGFSLEEKLHMVDEFVALLVRLESIKFREAGLIGCRVDQWKKSPRKLPCRMGLAELTPAGRAATEAEVFSFAVAGGFGQVATEKSRSALGLISEQLDAHLQSEMAEPRRVPRERGVRNYKLLQKIVDEMKILGFFETPEPSEEDANECGNVLHHPCLEPWSIKVVQTGSSDGQANDSTRRWKISSIIDWDEASSLPPVLAREPPVWLWDFAKNNSPVDPSTVDDSDGDYDDFDGDYDLLPADEYAEGNGKLSIDDQRIKAHFEASYVRQVSARGQHLDMAAYQNDAYGRGQWLRRVARFAQQGMYYNEDSKRLDKLEDEWAKYYWSVTKSSNVKISE